MDVEGHISGSVSAEVDEAWGRSPTSPVVLVVDADIAWRRRVARALHSRAIVRTAGSVDAARRSLREAPISGVVLELKIGGCSTMPLVEELSGRQPTLALSATTSVLDASRLCSLGAIFASKLEPRRSVHAKLERLAMAARNQGRARNVVIERLCASAVLTPAERETLRVYLASGNRGGLATALGIAETSVRSRVRALCRKLDLEHLADVYRLLFEMAVSAPDGANSNRAARGGRGWCTSRR